MDMALLNRLRDVVSVQCVSSMGYPVPMAGLEEILRRRNGFYAYNRGLHVFGICDSPIWHSLGAWNDAEGWIEEYGSLADKLFFYAEDAFGDQFAWDGTKVVRFIAETGEREDYASDIVGWLRRILSDPEEELGLGVIEDWIDSNGPIPEGMHLFPRIPLVAGGSTEPSEVVLIDPFEDMRFKGNFAKQIASLPDGAQIRINLGTPPDKGNPRQEAQE